MAGSRKKQRKRWQSMSAAAWEAVCDRCGRCCHERLIGEGGRLLSWGPPCAYLDDETGLCAAYERRFLLDISCKKVGPRTLERPGLLPPGCAYRRLVEAETTG